MAKFAACAALWSRRGGPWLVLSPRLRLSLRLLSPAAGGSGVSPLRRDAGPRRPLRPGPVRHTRRFPGLDMAA